MESRDYMNAIFAYSGYSVLILQPTWDPGQQSNKMSFYRFCKVVAYRNVSQLTNAMKVKVSRSFFPSETSISVSDPRLCITQRVS